VLKKTACGTLVMPPLSDGATLTTTWSTDRQKDASSALENGSIQLLLLAPLLAPLLATWDGAGSTIQLRIRLTALPREASGIMAMFMLLLLLPTMRCQLPKDGVIPIPRPVTTRSASMMDLSGRRELQVPQESAEATELDAQAHNHLTLI